MRCRSGVGGETGKLKKSEHTAGNLIWQRGEGTGDLMLERERRYDIIPFSVGAIGKRRCGNISHLSQLS
jgi:hypothetical protein